MTTETRDVEIDYTNHRGERRWRRITPVHWQWQSTMYYPEEQWILHAICFNVKEPRAFSLFKIHGWRKVDADDQT